MTVQGYILGVYEEYLGSEVPIDHPAGAQELFVETATDFNAEGGVARLVFDDDDTAVDISVVYSSIDTGEGILYLAAPTTTLVPAGTEVRVYPESQFKVVRVVTEQDTEPLPCKVAHALQPHAALAVGDRAPGAGETVVCDYIAGEWVVTDVLNRATVVPVESIGGGSGTDITDGAPPATAPDVTLTPVLGGLHATWQMPVENPDLTYFDVYASATTPVLTDSPAHLQGSTLASEFTLMDLDGVDLSYTSPTYVKVVARDKDGSGPESVQVSGIPRKISADDLGQGSVTPSSMSPTALVPNLVVNGSFDDLNAAGFAAAWVVDAAEWGSATVNDEDVLVGSRSLELELLNGWADVKVSQASDARFPVANGIGRTLLVGAAVRATTDLPSGFTLRVSWFDNTGDPLVAPAYTDVPDVQNAGVTTAWTRLEGQLPVPGGAAAAGVTIMHVGGVESAATVYVDAVSAEHVITAAHLVANAVTADKIAANAITAGKLSATALDGKVITGALIRNAAAGRRLEINEIGLQTYNGAEEITTSLTADEGGLQLAGVLTAGTGGSNVRISTSTGSGRIDFGGSDYIGVGRVMAAVDEYGANLNLVTPRREGGVATYFNINDRSRTEWFTPGLATNAAGIRIGGATFMVQDGVLPTPGNERPAFGLNGNDFVGRGNNVTLSALLGTLNLWAPFVTMPSVYEYQSGTGNSRQVWINATTGRLHTPTSARGMKQDIAPLEVDPAAVLELAPVTFRAKCDIADWEAGDVPEPDHEPGFIADDMVGTPLEPFVQFHNGEPTGIHYDRLVVALIPVLRDLANRVDALESV